MKKVILFVAMCLGLGVSAQADNNVLNHLGAGIEVGTTGIGFELSTPVTDYVQVRAGVAVMPTIGIKSFGVNVNQQNWTSMQKQFNEMTANKAYFSDADQAVITDMENKGFMKSDMPNSVNIDSKLGIGTNFKFLVDLLPFKNSSFHVTVGFYSGKKDIFSANTTNCQDQLEAITYYNEKLAGKTFTTVNVPGGPQNQQTYNFGNPLSVTVGGDGTGGVNVVKPNGRQIDGTIEAKAFKPYVGIGFGRAVPKKTRCAFACDLGVQFWNTPKVIINNQELVTSGISDANGGDILKTISKVTVYPCMNFRITGRIF